MEAIEPHIVVPLKLPVIGEEFLGSANAQGKTLERHEIHERLGYGKGRFRSEARVIGVVRERVAIRRC